MKDDFENNEILQALDTTNLQKEKPEKEKLSKEKAGKKKVEKEKKEKKLRLLASCKKHHPSRPHVYNNPPKKMQASTFALVRKHLCTSKQALLY